MYRRTFTFFKQVSLVLTAGVVFGGLSCVTAADLLGTGLSLTGALSPGANGLMTAGAGLDLIADLVRFTPIGG